MGGTGGGEVVGKKKYWVGKKVERGGRGVVAEGKVWPREVVCASVWVKKTVNSGKVRGRREDTAAGRSGGGGNRMWVGGWKGRMGCKS